MIWPLGWRRMALGWGLGCRNPLFIWKWLERASEIWLLFVLQSSSPYSSSSVSSHVSSQACVGEDRDRDPTRCFIGTLALMLLTEGTRSPIPRWWGSTPMPACIADSWSLEPRACVPDQAEMLDLAVAAWSLAPRCRVTDPPERLALMSDTRSLEPRRCRPVTSVMLARPCRWYGGLDEYQCPEKQTESEWERENGGKDRNWPGKTCGMQLAGNYVLTSFPLYVYQYIYLSRRSLYPKQQQLKKNGQPMHGTTGITGLPQGPDGDITHSRGDTDDLTLGSHN